MQRTKGKFAAAFGIAIVALGFTACAGARSDDDDLRKTEVSYSDLDLGRASDATELYGRIERAAREVCFTGFGAAQRRHDLERKCMKKAIGDAVQSVANANLSSVHAARAGKRSMVASSR